MFVIVAKTVPVVVLLRAAGTLANLVVFQQQLAPLIDRFLVLEAHMAKTLGDVLAIVLTQDEWAW